MQTKIKLNFSFALIAYQIHTIKISSLDEFSPELCIKKKKKKEVHGEHGGEKKKQFSLLSIFKDCCTIRENHGHHSFVRKFRK